MRGFESVEYFTSCSRRGRTAKGGKTIAVFLYDSSTDPDSSVGREAGPEPAYRRKARHTTSPTLISAVSFYIHHVSIICLYGNRLGSRPNAFSPLFALSLIVI